MRRIKVVALLLLTISSCKPDCTQPEEKIADLQRALEIERNKKPIPEKITFPSMDELPITANLYHLNDTAPVMVLCPQAGWNKVEYVESAKTFMEMGYNCLATDQRSGGALLEFRNETKEAAEKDSLPTDYLNAEQDIIAGVDFASKRYDQPVILVGSSYSSTLALWVASENENVKAVISFSPGNYFVEQKGDLALRLQNMEKPMLVTSSKQEALDLSTLISGMELTEMQYQFEPEEEGYHGARALWKTNNGNEEYWTAVTDFLNKIKDF